MADIYPQSTETLSANSQAQVWTGSAWTNLLQAIAAANTTGTGVGAVNELVYDGTNFQLRSGFAGDAGQNPALVAGNRKEVTYSTTTAQAVATQDCSNYRWASVQVTAQGTGSTVTFQISNDNTNWFSVALVLSNTAGGAPVTNTTTTGIWSGAVNARYFRLNVTGISAGTTSGTVEFFSVPGAHQAVGANLNSLTNFGTTLGVITGAAPVTSLTNASATGAGTALNNNAARSSHSLVVTTSAGVTAGTVVLQGSNDNSNWFTTTASISTTSASTTSAANVANFPFQYIRANITSAITGGTVTATIASAG